jgi:hypothetical protein
MTDDKPSKREYRALLRDFNMAYDGDDTKARGLAALVRGLQCQSRAFDHAVRKGMLKGH